jgi:hypothetical protein
LFINTGNQNSISETVKIPTAALPTDFKPPTKQEIKVSNEKAVHEKSEEIQERASDENNDAMKKGIKLFQSAK